MGAMTPLTLPFDFTYFDLEELCGHNLPQPTYAVMSHDTILVIRHRFQSGQRFRDINVRIVFDDHHESAAGIELPNGIVGLGLNTAPLQNDGRRFVEFWRGALPKPYSGEFPPAVIDYAYLPKERL